MWYRNIRSASFSFVTIHACDRQTDRQTDGQTDRITTPKTALAYARAVKTTDEHKKSENICRVDEGGPVLAAVCGEKDLWERYMHRQLKHPKKWVGQEIISEDER